MRSQQELEEHQGPCRTCFSNPPTPQSIGTACNSPLLVNHINPCNCSYGNSLQTLCLSMSPRDSTHFLLHSCWLDQIKPLVQPPKLNKPSSAHPPAPTVLHTRPPCLPISRPNRASIASSFLSSQGAEAAAAGGPLMPCNIPPLTVSADIDRLGAPQGLKLLETRHTAASQLHMQPTVSHKHTCRTEVHADVLVRRSISKLIYMRVCLVTQRHLPRANPPKP